MTRTAFPNCLQQTRADTVERTRRHAEHCILLAVVTSTDVAAALIDQAVTLRAGVERTIPAAQAL